MIINHHLTKYVENGQRYAEAWIQINIFNKSFCISKKKIKVSHCVKHMESENITEVQAQTNRELIPLISEKLINLKDLDKLTGRTYLKSKILNDAIKNKNYSNIEVISETLTKEIKAIRDFEFEVEFRKCYATEAVIKFTEL